MKKLKFLIVPIVCMILAVGVVAQTSSSNVYEFADRNKVVTFDENCTLSEDEKQSVAERLVYGEPEDSGIQTYAWCWLTGHDLSYDAVGVITHKAKSLSPRCYEETYQVATCSKCDYMEEELISAVYIVCCPED